MFSLRFFIFAMNRMRYNKKKFEFQYHFCMHFYLDLLKIKLIELHYVFYTYFLHTLYIDKILEISNNIGNTE